jgi:arsenite methyltransferase
MPQSRPCTIYERFGVTSPANEGIRPGGLKLTERAVTHCRFEPQAPILDMGCGNGATVQYLRSAHNLWAIGIDASHILAVESRKRSASCPLVIGDAGRSPFRDGAFDGLFLECTLSLMSDQNAVLAECHRVLRPGGAIVISDVHVRNPINAADLRKLPPASCLRGATEAEASQAKALAAGFEIELWEDHSDLLKDFAVRIIWTLGSMSAFWGLAGHDEIDPDVVEEIARRSRPGYHLLIGRKTTIL